MLTPVLTDERPVLTLPRPVERLLMPVEVEVDRLVTLLFVVLRPVLSEETPVLNDETPVLTLLRESSADAAQPGRGRG